MFYVCDQLYCNIRFYRNKSLHLLSHLCSIHVHEEIEFWGIDQNLMDACCLMKHYPELQASQNESRRVLKRNEIDEKIAQEEDFGDTYMGRLRTFLWYLTEYPERTKAARVRFKIIIR